ncbi:GPW/gp25 family protein [Thalassoporum mexicanum PCC 7367]|uniref:GPW/gp25 family protein n=1 Tax=Thalassoporum mexicanum TaxID=3457544 RepID=UPI00029F85F8|nr:GPW/gp25 family protein [Pseudanabaena sp. PCC 7367]AFY70353.1 GPW/gp25 family protein [Pseudanabaena sp. PCC 7367]
MIDSDQNFLGRGWSFPPTFNKITRQVQQVSGAQDIRESLGILLSTSIGERVMQPTYGCDLSELMFEPLTPTASSSIKELIRTAILYHEPRIKLDAIDLRLDHHLEGVVNIRIDYTVLSTNSRFSFVYPFYFQEGIGLV